MDFTKIFPNGFDANKYSARPSDEIPAVAAYKFLSSLGFKPPMIVQGQLMRFPDAQDVAKGNMKGQGGWAIYNEFHGDNVIGFMTYGSWHGDPERETWSSISQDYMSNDQRAAYLDAIDAAKRIREAEQEKRKEIANAKFSANWVGYSEANENHPYLVKKGIKPNGARQDGDLLVIASYLDDKIVGLQEIGPDGEKKIRFGSTKGYFPIGAKTKTIFVCEGFSTGATIHEASGNMVLVAFDAGNLFNICSYAKSACQDCEIVVCSDDDRHGEINAGMRAGRRIVESLGIKCLSPVFKGSEGTDFNDLASLEGIDVVKQQLLIKKPALPMPKVNRRDDHPHGIIGQIADYYNATSGNEQYGFALQTAIAIGSLVCGRNFKTDNENYAALYLLNVGKTATGKEHCKTVIEKVLAAGGLDKHISGDGFTSSGGVMSELIRKPRIITVIDEFGMYLEAAGSGGNAMQKEANSYLMQAITRCHGTIRAKNYSTMTISRKDALEVQDRRVHNPSITMVGITTPSTFFDNITVKDVLSGFINRFVVSISDAQPTIRKRANSIDVPEQIINWMRSIQKRAETAGNGLEVSIEQSKPVEIIISEPAREIQVQFEIEMLARLLELEPRGMDGLAGRANEMAMKLSLIMALGRDPWTSIVSDIDMQWAVNYIRSCFNRLVEEIGDKVSGSTYEAYKKEIIEAFKINPDGIKFSDMQRMSPFSKHKRRDLVDILESLEAAEIIERSEAKATRGRPTLKYFYCG